MRLMPGYSVLLQEVDAALNLRKREYMNEWGERCIITDLYDADGDWMDPDEPDNHDVAVTLVARHPLLGDGCWYSLDVRDFYSIDDGEGGLGRLH